MATVNPYIGFNGRCREAMTFYKACLGGGELFFVPVEGSPMEAECPPAMKDQILHSSLVKDGFVLMGTDMVGPGGYVPGNSIALSVNCVSAEELNALFTALSAGGQVVDPVKQQFWGALFGMVTDKFGVGWMLNYDNKG